MYHNEVIIVIITFSLKKTSKNEEVMEMLNAEILWNNLEVYNNNSIFPNEWNLRVMIIIRREKIYCKNFLLFYLKNVLRSLTSKN